MSNNVSIMLERILVVLPNWFGETLFATPFLRSVRQQRPHAFIATLGWPQCRQVLQHNTVVEEMIDYDERGVHRNPLRIVRLIRELHTRDFDTVFILRKSLSRTLLAALAGIAHRVGFANAKSGWLLTHRVPMPQTPMHKSSTYFALLTAVGLSPTTTSYEYVVDEDERRRARALLEAQHLAMSRPIVVLHPGANWFHKRWSPERFAALGDQLIQAHGVQVLITGGPDDALLAQRIRGSMHRDAACLAGSTTLRELAACLESASLVVSNDTGVLHIATALHRPVVALYGPTSPALTGPLGDPQRTRILHHPECCPSIPCYAPDQPRHPGVDAIQIEEVVAAASQLLARDPS